MIVAAVAILVIPLESSSKGKMQYLRVAIILFMVLQAQVHLLMRLRILHTGLGVLHLNHMEHQMLLLLMHRTGIQWLLTHHWYIMVTMYFQLVTWARAIHGIHSLQMVLLMESHTGNTTMQSAILQVSKPSD
jgi:hypothetical protein